jgi:hypothetical protein
MRGCSGFLALLLGIALICCGFAWLYVNFTSPPEPNDPAERLEVLSGRLAVLRWVVPALVVLLGCVLFWLVLHAAGTDRLAQELRQAQRDDADVRYALADSHRRVERQTVLLRALVSLLRQSQGLTEADLLARFRQVEAERAVAPPKVCLQCGRPVNLRHLRCLYCDVECPAGSAFDLLEMGAWPAATSPPADGQGITTRPGA